MDWKELVMWAILVLFVVYVVVLTWYADRAQDAEEAWRRRDEDPEWQGWLMQKLDEERNVKGSK